MTPLTLNRLGKLLMATVLMLAASGAAAHSGHGESSFLSGLMHPLLGLDHLLAMAAIGFWSSRQNATLKRGAPVFVVGGMLLGAGIAWGGGALPGVETGIAFTVLLTGFLVATLARLPTALGASFIAAFMVFHGAAHAAEMPAGAMLGAYLVGFLTATLGITFLGRGLGALLARSLGEGADSRVSRAMGGAVAVVGALLAA